MKITINKQNKKVIFIIKNKKFCNGLNILIEKLVVMGFITLYLKLQ